MDKISIVMPVALNSRRESVQYLPIIHRIEEEKRLCMCYGLKAIKENNKCGQEFRLTYLPYICSKLISKMNYIFKKSKHNAFFVRLDVFDKWASKRIRKDDSTIVYTDMLLPKTVHEAHRLGKIVVVMTGNSNPVREYERITDEYKKYNIRNRYLYGDVRYRDRCVNSLNEADYFIAISEVSSKTYNDTGYDMKKCIIIPKTGTDFCMYKNTTVKEKAFITTAFHCFIKGTHRLLEAWKTSGIDNIPLHVVGTLNDDMKEFIEKYGPFNNVIFEGAKSRDELKEFYKHYDAVGILLSLSEGAGRVTPEMMSYGYPMIVSPDATCDLIVDGYNGYIVEPTDEEKIVYVLKWFADDWNRVDALHENVYSSISGRSLENFARDVADELLNLCKTE